jgi:hypothetical protein
VSDRKPLTALLHTEPGLWLVPLVVAAAWVLGALGVADKGPVLCPWRLTTGLACAGCGLTRGFAALVHGHWQAAIASNLITPAVLFWMIAWWLVAVTAIAHGRTVPATPRWLARPALVAVIGYWVVLDVWLATRPGAFDAAVQNSPLLRWLAAWHAG